MATLDDIIAFIEPLHRFQRRCLIWMMGPPEVETCGPDHFGAHDVLALELGSDIVPTPGSVPDAALLALGLARSVSSLSTGRREWATRLGLTTLGIEPAGYTDFYSRMFAAFYGKIPAPGLIGSDGPTSAEFRAFYATFYATRGQTVGYTYPPGEMADGFGGVRTSNSVAVGGWLPYPPG